MIQIKITAWVLIFISFLFGISTTYAEDKVMETRYHLDTGVYFIWGIGSNHEDWPVGIYNNPVEYRMKHGINLAVNKDPETLKIISINPYNYENFNFNKPEQYTWNKSFYGIDQQTYEESYMPFALSNLQSVGSPLYDTKTGELIFGYSGDLKSRLRKLNETLIGHSVDPGDDINGDFDVKDNITFYNNLSDLERWMGEIPLETELPMEAMLKQGSSGALQGFLYFAPMVIEYQIIDPAIPLLSPIVLIGCKAESMFIGLPTPIRGSVLNRNEKPVITYYTLTANGSKVMASGWALQDGGKSKKVDSSYTIPADTKPGTQFVFKLEARQTWAYNAPERYLPKEEGEPREDNPAYEPFINSHTYVSAVNAWYKKDAPWVNGEATCRKTAVLLPEAPLNHEMNPSVIVE